MLPYCRFDQQIYFTVQVETSNISYEIQRPYVDFLHFSRKLQQLLPKNNKIPKLRRDHIANLLKNNEQKYYNRQEDLNRFVQALLLHLPQSILESDMFLGFFSDMTEFPSPSKFKRVFSLGRNPKPVTDMQLSHFSTVNDSCMRSNFQQSVISTASSRSSTSTFASAHSLDEEDELIRFKIVYDSQNIVIIRVSRFISFETLRSIILQKFALLEIQLPESLTLMSTGNRCSASSVCAADLDPTTITLISTDEELQNMQLKWSCRQKITLRCITDAM
ncbi:hypothetical protein K501DRAFT_281620 [Backusella circina FSU 941]|nr:hypothetical protein K501DRAFT_281620 [Backusella circina FSU 941]